MGIAGLLQLDDVQSSMRSIHDLEKAFANKVAAVDGHGWLHKALTHSYPSIYLDEDGKDYFIEHFMRDVTVTSLIPKFLALLKRLHCLFTYSTPLIFSLDVTYLRVRKIIPLIVFDGMKLPAKQWTNIKRKERREKTLLEVAKLRDNGEISDARKKLEQCAEITRDIMDKIIKKLRDERIPYLISPYESDAQLTHLVNNHHVDFVISEDSDLIPFGAERILFKFKKSKNCVPTFYEKIRLFKPHGLFKDLDYVRRMCIISGCDYLPSLQGIGLHKAKLLMLDFQRLNVKDPSGFQPDFYEFLSKELPKRLPQKSTGQVTEEYLKKFKEAELTFQFQIVYDLTSKKMVPLNPYNDTFHDGRRINILNLPFAGSSLSPDLAYQHSIGNLTDKHDLVSKDTYNPGRKWLNNIKEDFHSLIENVNFHNFSSSPVISTPRSQLPMRRSPLTSPSIFNSKSQISPQTPSSSKRKSLSPGATPKRSRLLKGFGDCPFMQYNTQVSRSMMVRELSSQGSSLNASSESLNSSLTQSIKEVCIASGSPTINSSNSFVPWF